MIDLSFVRIIRRYAWCFIPFSIKGNGLIILAENVEYRCFK
ncbi:Uncharacterised protein [Serratia liquefaciens]|nr:Uncharacterised protein [Serratia liquefaciens]CAI1665318.1 Uncharacterised protein [Serratia liquefaciens]